MSEIKLGDRVRYTVGRGFAEGRVMNLAEGIATLATAADKQLNRRVSRLVRLDAPATPAANAAV